MFVVRVLYVCLWFKYVFVFLFFLRCIVCFVCLVFVFGRVLFLLFGVCCTFVAGSLLCGHCCVLF